MNHVLQWLEDNRREILGTWEELHAMPEPAFCEKKTAAYLASSLEKAGYSVRTSIGGTGVVGILDSGRPGPFVGMRADMDALVYEHDGVRTAKHTCGHDAHSAAVLWAAKALAAAGYPQNGRLLVLFQPAEEVLGGAKAVLESGVLDGVEQLVGLHLRPVDELPKGMVSPAILHGASDLMTVTVTGLSAHGARPHQGRNAAEAACIAVAAVWAIRLSPSVPHSVKLTSIRSGGEAFNVIPDRAVLTFDLRAQTNELMQELQERTSDAVRFAVAACGCEAVCTVKGGVPAATRCEKLERTAAQAITRVLGQQAVATPSPSSGGEDFHCYAQQIPSLCTTMLGIGADLRPGLHKEDMTFDHEAVVIAAKVLAETMGILFGSGEERS